MCFLENLHSAIKVGLKNRNIPISDRVKTLTDDDLKKLEYFTILNLWIGLEGISGFFRSCGFEDLTSEEIQGWVLCCINLGFLRTEVESDKAFFLPEDEVYVYFARELSSQDILECHVASDKFFISWLADTAADLEIDLAEAKDLQRKLLIGPNGVLDLLAHSPQFQGTFLGSIKLAVSWQEHLFQIKKYEEASDIVNMICFAIARQGERTFAESLLVRCISATKGISNLVSRINLATLLREDANLKPALRLYRGTILGLLKNRAYQQLAMVFSEIGVIHSHNGHLLRAAFTLEICSMLHGALRNGKSQAIAQSQLANVYRYVGLYGLALRASTLACIYFRAHTDYLNLGRALLTCGNIYYNLKLTDQALECFDESSSIGKMISDSQSMCGASSGKARVLMMMNDLDNAKQILDEVISIRQRNSDHSIGVEYQNMGYLYELKGNLAMAIVWYNKALKNFRQYMPVEVTPCELRIQIVQRQLTHINNKK